MTVTYGFYNSLGGDRTYDAIDISRMFDGVISDGVFEDIDDAFNVTPSSGMIVAVGLGKAWFNHTWTINDASLLLTHDTADPTLNRYDIIVLEVDETSRINSIKIVKGTPAASPVLPTLIDTATVHQYPLANITITAADGTISSGDIEMVVGTVDCPFVTVPQAVDVSGVLEVEVFS